MRFGLPYAPLKLDLIAFKMNIISIRKHMADTVGVNIGIKHGFSCINVCQVPREMLKTEAEGRDFQRLPRDLANVNALENNV